MPSLPIDTSRLNRFQQLEQQRPTCQLRRQVANSDLQNIIMSGGHSAHAECSVSNLVGAHVATAQQLCGCTCSSLTRRILLIHTVKDRISRAASSSVSAARTAASTSDISCALISTCSACLPANHNHRSMCPHCIIYSLLIYGGCETAFQTYRQSVQAKVHT